jgi:Domain of unknown function (DUF4956)
VPEWLTWLTNGVLGGADIDFDVLVARIAAALVLGCFVAGAYALTQPRQQERTLVTTLVMLSVLIAMVTIVIGSNTARAFSLVGALAIVRFRTLVEDTRDTAFVMFAVGVGMAAGAGSVVVALVAAPIVALVALVLRARAVAPGTAATLLVRLGVGRDPGVLLRPVLANHTVQSRVSAAVTARQGAALDVTYLVSLRNPDGAVALVGELNQLEGVLSAELRVV